jgi:signal transduction histidine kinase/CheY-like chemotaxis protein
MFTSQRGEPLIAGHTATADDQLRDETVRWTIVGLLGLSFALHWVAILTLSTIAPACVVAIMALTLVALAAYTVAREPGLAAWVIVAGVTAVLSYALSFLPAHLVAPWFSLVVLLAGALCGLGVGAAMTALATVGLLATAYLSPDLLPVDVAQAAVGLNCASLFVTWLVSRPARAALEWSWSSYLEAVVQRNLARDRQAELGRLSKSLNESYHRLEQFNLELERARRAAQEARRLKTQFAAAVSHELRTPLNLIIGFCEMMVLSPSTAYGQRLPAGFRADLDAVYRNACHLSGLVDDILDLSQIDAERMALHRTWTPVAAVVDGAVTTVASLFYRRGLTLTVAPAGDLPALYVDETRVRQILINLLANAARLTDHGGAVVEVGREDGRVVVAVRDTGPGIAPSELPHVFDEFYSGERRGDRSGGTGLGLAVSKRFAELHGGDIRVDSELGRGTTFFLALPEDADAPPTLSSGPAQQELFGRRAGGQAERSIVVLDAAGQVGKVFERYLDDHKVVRAGGWLEAAEIAQREAVQAVVVGSPELSCWPAPSGASAVPLEIAHLPMVSCPLTTARRSAEQLGVADYLLKPVSRDQLRTALRRVKRRLASVLVIDDDPEMARLLTRMVRSLSRGCRVLTAGDGQEGMRLAREGRPEVVLVDLLMPTMDGYAFIGAMRADPALAATPILVVTAHGAEQETVVASHLTVARAGGLSVLEVMRCLKSALDHLEPGTSAPGPRPARVG